MSAMAAAQQHYGHSFVMSSASPTDDDWDGNIVLSDMEEPNREEGGRFEVESRMLLYQQPTQTGHMIAEFQNHWKGSPASGKVVKSVITNSKSNTNCD